MPPNETPPTTPPQPNQPNDYVVNEETTDQPVKPAKTPITKRLSAIILNPYLWGLIVLLGVGGAIAWYAIQSNDGSISITGRDVTSSTLSGEDFAALAEEQASIDSTNKTLNVQANSVFDGTMLVRSSLEVQGQLRVGQELTLNDLTVAGQGTVNNLDISQDLNVQGEAQFLGATVIQNSLSVASGLTVAGSGTFAGNLTANTIEAGSLSFSGDLNMNGRIITGGQQTSASSGNAIGSGGTVSVNGNNTAGSVNINTGGSPSSGILVNVQFGSSYSSTPRVNITPVGSASGGLNWYVTRNVNGFSIGSSSTPPAGSNFTFDYFVVQ